MKHMMNLRPDSFEMIESGKKIYELRLYDEKRQCIKIGDEIEFVNIDKEQERLIVYVKNLHVFSNFEALYSSLPLLKCGYTEHNLLTAGPEDMEDYYSLEKQAQYGVVAFEIEKKIRVVTREANKNDLEDILQLYLYLHEKSIPKDSALLINTWDNIINDTNHHFIVCQADDKIVASCVCVIIPNLTRNVRPYAFIENVVTHEEYRKQGYATACLNYAKQIAEKNNCYKMMLLTGSKEESTFNFYRNAGYNSSDKTAFIQWINM